ncbi:hypothetical protein GCM10022402_37720 [Salinactinospora qingdaonensis]|uniref:Uncharacterized protein n=1 Tax=Salinactinospora qingdaonensis TaxID=702744 RepID=A0ABP7G792_9ACTN
MRRVGLAKEKAVDGAATGAGTTVRAATSRRRETTIAAPAGEGSGFNRLPARSPSGAAYEVPARKRLDAGGADHAPPHRARQRRKNTSGLVALRYASNGPRRYTAP